MKIGTKVKIKDGSYMLTIVDGKLSHFGKNNEVVGWCKDTFTVTCNGGVFPTGDPERAKLINDHIITNDVNGEVWYCSKINIKKVDYEFKVGDWVYWSGSNPIIGRIKQHCTEFSDSWSLADTNNKKGLEYSSCSETNLRLATPKEIGTHLRNICNEKYVGKRVKCLYDKCVYIIGTQRHSMEEIHIRDNTYWMLSDDGVGVKVFDNGQWAEILLEKKKLPKTKDEFIFFLQEVLTRPTGYDTRISLWAESFLQDYE